jgi:hypothetical protein
VPVEETLDSYTHELYANSAFVPDLEVTAEQLRSSSLQLRQLERDLVNRARYLDAKLAVAALKKCQAALKSREVSEKTQSSLAELTHRRDDLLDLIANEYCLWDEQLREQERKTVEGLERLKGEQEQELREFDESVPTELTPLFKRSSVVYLEMRVNEKNLALGRRFDDAEKMRRKADRLAVVEQKANVERMESCYEERRARMQKRHELTIKNFLANARARKKDLVAGRERAVEGHVARVRIIDKEMRRLQGGDEEESG